MSFFFNIWASPRYGKNIAKQDAEVERLSKKLGLSPEEVLEKGQKGDFDPVIGFRPESNEQFLDFYKQHIGDPGDRSLRDLKADFNTHVTGNQYLNKTTDDKKTINQAVKLRDEMWNITGGHALMDFGQAGRVANKFNQLYGYALEGEDRRAQGSVEGDAPLGGGFLSNQKFLKDEIKGFLFQQPSGGQQSSASGQSTSGDQAAADRRRIGVGRSGPRRLSSLFALSDPSQKTLLGG